MLLSNIDNVKKGSECSCRMNSISSQADFDHPYIAQSKVPVAEGIRGVLRPFIL